MTTSYRPKNTFSMQDLQTIAKGLELTTIYAPVSPDERALYLEIIERIRRKPVSPPKKELKDRVEFK